MRHDCLLRQPLPRPAAPRPLGPLLCVGGLAVLGVTAHAGESYGSLGLPGVMVGYAQAVNELVVLRADYATLGSRSKDGNHEGIDYRGTARVARVGLFADYFPAGNGFRLTAGLTVNNMSIKLRSNFAGGVVNVGGNNYLVTPGDYLNADIKMPTVTPYVGLGWGHHVREPGWGVLADLGLSIGRAKVDVDTNLANRGVPQADIDRETRELRDGVGKIQAIPQVSVGLSYRY